MLHTSTCLFGLLMLMISFPSIGYSVIIICLVSVSMVTYILHNVMDIFMEGLLDDSLVSRCVNID